MPDNFRQELRKRYRQAPPDPLPAKRTPLSVHSPFAKGNKSSSHSLRTYRQFAKNTTRCRANLRTDAGVPLALPMRFYVANLQQESECNSPAENARSPQYIPKGCQPLAGGRGAPPDDTTGSHARIVGDLAGVEADRYDCSQWPILNMYICTKMCYTPPTLNPSLYRACRRHRRTSAL